MAALKTLHLTNAWHGQSGGIRTFYTAMLTVANRLQRPMRVVVPGEHDEVTAIGAFGRLYTIAAPRVPFVDRRYRVLLPHHFLARDGALRRILRDEQPDVLEVCDKYALPFFAGWIRRHLPDDLCRPTIVGLSCERADHSLQAMGPGGRALSIAARCYIGSIYLPQCDYHLANSAYTAAELMRAQRPAHRREVLRIPMGLDVAAFGPRHRSESWREAWRARLRLPAGGPLVVYAGRLSQEKRLTRAIDAVAWVRRAGVPAGLVLVGSGPESPRLAQYAAQVAPGIVGFAGHAADRAALAEAYASADAFLHVNDREPFGIGPLEAMASGVPVVVPRAGGVLTYANDGNAWLAEPDAASLAAAVLTAVASPDPARLARASVTAAAYDWSIVGPRIFETYDALRARALGADRDRWPAPRRSPPQPTAPATPHAALDPTRRSGS